jgi:hypothetical protein
LGELLALVHGNFVGHFGRERTASLLHPRVSWPSDLVDISAWVSNCPVCQLAHTSPDQAPQLLATALDYPFGTVQADLIGPLPTSPAGNNYILTLVDRATRLTELVPLPTAEAAAAAEAFLSSWVCRHGVPSFLTTDGGSTFTAHFFEEFLSCLHTHHHISLPLAPQGHGLVERVNQVVEKVLRAFLAERHHIGVEWDDLLPRVAFSINICPNRTTGLSPFAFAYGRRPRLPIDSLLGLPPPPPAPLGDPLEHARQLYTSLLSTISKVQTLEAALHAKRKADYLDQLGSRPRASYSAGDYVLLHHPRPHKLLPPWRGPYAVVGPAARPGAFSLRDLITGDTFDASFHRLALFKHLHLSETELKFLSAPPGEAIVTEVLEHGVDDQGRLHFLVHWGHTAAPSWVPFEGNTNVKQLISYMREHGVSRPRKVVPPPPPPPAASPPAPERSPSAAPRRSTRRTPSVGAAEPPRKRAQPQPQHGASRPPAPPSSAHEEKKKKKK